MLATMAAERTTLYCREGGSNKQYTVWLEKSGTGWLVNFQFGPVGGWVQGGTKTQEPVTRAQAEKIRDGLLKQKAAKGYTAGANAPVFSQPVARASASKAAPKAAKVDEDSGLRPMLLTWGDESDLERFLKDDRWAIQEKVNGKRIMLRVTSAGVEGFNKRGLPCPIPMAVEKEMAGLIGEFDGELVGETYHAFDMTMDGSDDIRHRGYGYRHGMLEMKVRGMKSVKIVNLVMGSTAKRKLAESLRTNRKEGVVFKMLDAHHEAGRRPNLDRAIAVKIKFYAEIAVEVLHWNKDKSSVEVAALKDGRLVSVGKVTIHEKYVSQVVQGAVVRVKYLYATEAAQLYQANLDPTDDGSVIADQVAADSISLLKFENKD